MHTISTMYCTYTICAETYDMYDVADAVRTQDEDAEIRHVDYWKCKTFDAVGKNTAENSQ